MTPSAPPSSTKNNRARRYGALFIVVGLGFLVYGGLGLLDLYSRPDPMFDLGEGLSPEKGMMWAKCLAGGSVTLVGILLLIQNRLEGRRGKKSGCFPRH